MSVQQPEKEGRSFTIMFDGILLYFIATRFGFFKETLSHDNGFLKKPKHFATTCCVYHPVVLIVTKKILNTIKHEVCYVWGVLFFSEEGPRS
jgi:hypothetical protein